MKKWILLVVTALLGGCVDQPPKPQTYDHKTEVTTENGEITSVRVYFPGIGASIQAETYRDMDALIGATRTVLSDLERIRQLMPEGDSQPPPSVVEPNEN